MKVAPALPVQQKQLALTEQHLASEKARHHAPMHASEDAIAYIHEGILIKANGYWRALFRLSADDIPGLCILDLIAQASRSGFKASLRSLAHIKNHTHAVRCCRPDGKVFDTRMELSSSAMDGEQWIRLVIRRRTTDGIAATMPTLGETSLDTADSPRLRKSGQIENTFENHRLTLLYQPIVSLDGETRETYSVAARLLDRPDPNDEGQPLTSTRDSGRPAEIDRWTIRQAIQKLADPQLASRKVNVSLQLSREGMLDPTMLLWICDCLREFKARGNRLYFEFEYVLLEQPPAGLRPFLDGLQQINCRFVCRGVDCDEGDHSLLSTLGVEIAQLTDLSLPQLCNSPSDQERLKKLNAKLQQMGIKTRVDKVQDADSLALLWHMGVNQVQGDFLQAPSDSLWT